MIAFAHYSQSGDISGVTSWLQRMLLHLHAEGFPLVVLLQHFGAHPEESELRQTLLAAGVSVESEVRADFTEERVRSTLAFLERHQPTLFLPQCSESFAYAAAIAGDQGLPWALTLHSDDPFYWAQLTLAKPWAHSGRVVAVSNHILQLCLDRHPGASVTLIPYGVSIADDGAQFSQTPFRVLYSGRMVEHQKRLSLVLEALALACEADACMEGRLLGDGPGLEAARSWVAERGLAARITFAGRLDADGVTAELGAAQALLLMSDFEGLPLALLEAMAAGVVPVAREIPSGIPEVVRHEMTGLLVDDQPSTAAAALVRLARDRGLWEKCSAQARKQVASQYSEAVCHRAWQNLVHEMNLKVLSAPLYQPARLDLPPQHPELAYWDRRKLTFSQRLKRKIQGTMAQLRKA